MSIGIYYLSEVRTHSIYLSGTVFLFAYRILERDLKRELASSGLENNWELHKWSDVDAHKIKNLKTR